MVRLYLKGIYYIDIIKENNMQQNDVLRKEMPLLLRKKKNVK